MLNLGTPELIVILLVALIVLGPTKLPETARQIGKAMGELRRLSSGFKAEMRDAMQEPVKKEPVEPGGSTEPTGSSEPPSPAPAPELDSGDTAPPAPG